MAADPVGELGLEPVRQALVLAALAALPTITDVHVHLLG